MLAPRWQAPLGSYSALAISRDPVHRQRRPPGRNRLDIEIPIQVLADIFIRWTREVSSPDRDVSDFRNLEMSVRWGRAAGGRGAVAVIPKSNSVKWRKEINVAEEVREMASLIDSRHGARR